MDVTLKIFFPVIMALIGVIIVMISYLLSETKRLNKDIDKLYDLFSTQVSVNKGFIRLAKMDNSVEMKSLLSALKNRIEKLERIYPLTYEHSGSVIGKTLDVFQDEDGLKLTFQKVNEEDHND